MEEIEHNKYKCTLDEVDEDLLKLPKDIALAHCVAQDLKMGAGIAVKFKHYFGGVGKLIDQNLIVGSVGIVNPHKAFLSLVKKLKEFNITKLGNPKIGCGLDSLDWNDVKKLITSIFYGSNVHITECIPSNIIKYKPLPLLKVYITPKNIWEMEALTNIILFIDKEKLKNNNWTDDLIDKINSRIQFKEKLLKDIKKKKCNPGTIKRYIIENKKINCAFISQDAPYSSIEKAFKRINRLVKNDEVLAIQNDPIKLTKNWKHTSRMVLILRSIINNSELWLCGDMR